MSGGYLGATGSIRPSGRLPFVPPGPRAVRLHGRVGVLHPAGLPEPAPPRGPRVHLLTARGPGPAEGGSPLARAFRLDGSCRGDYGPTSNMPSLRPPHGAGAASRSATADRPRTTPGLSVAPRIEPANPAQPSPRPPRRRLGAGRLTSRLQPPAANSGGHPDAALAFHGVDGVAHEICPDLVEFSGVSRDSR